MGLETSTYISGLTSSWPPSGDPKSQGDDHLRLIKGVLQATFPTASKPFYIPTAEATSGTLALDATDQNNIIAVTTGASDISVTLPPAFDTTKAGWSCEVVKVSYDAGAVMVTISGGGNIVSRSGATASIRVGAFAEPCRFLWTGVSWIAVKPGPLIGSTVNWDGDTIPFGYMLLNGATYNTTTYAELFAAYGYGLLMDKRGRTEIGAGTGSGLTARTIRGSYGSESMSLALTNLPNHIHSGTVAAETTDHTHNLPGSASNSSANVAPIANGIFGYINYGATNSGGRSASHTHTFSTDNLSGANAAAFGLLQPSMATQKIIRAC